MSKICPIVNGECLKEKCLAYISKPIIKYISKGSRVPLKPIKDGEYYFCTALNLEIK